MPAEMDIYAVSGIVILPAVVFALLYFPILTKLSRGLLSPYAKADVRRRLYAATIDSLLVVTTWFFYWTSNSVLYLAAGAGYVLFRDAMCSFFFRERTSSPSSSRRVHSSAIRRVSD